MKQLIQTIKRIRQQKPNIPQSVMKQVENTGRMRIIFESEIKENDRNWQLSNAVDLYFHNKILWKTEKYSGSKLVRISGADINRYQNVLLQKVVWGHKDSAYYYGTISFIKFKNVWYHITPTKIRKMMKWLPTLEELQVEYQDENGLQKGTFDNMLEFFFTYEENED